MDNPPELPHVEVNVTPLSDILARYSQHSFQELQTLIHTLQSKAKNDNAKKKAFLDLLVGIRQNFVRLYVLCKWARASKDIGKLIDVFVWLRGQNQKYADSIFELSTIKSSLMSAKLPDPDLTTAIEVLMTGRPQLPTHGLLSKKPLSPYLILKTLRNLNVSLSTRMALEDDLPPAFQNYKVEDGRVVFHVHKSFQASIAIADDSVDDSPFFLVDFEFSFALKDGSLIQASTPLPAVTHSKIEKLANAALAKEGLFGLYDLLHRFATTFKLYLLHRQLVAMRIGLWKGNLSHTYNAEKCFVVIKYWAKKPSSSKQKSTIEIGINKQTNDLSFRWVKDGKLITDHGISFDEFDGDEDNDDGEMINLERLIRRITKRHSELNIQQIYDDIADRIEDAEKLVSINREGGNCSIVFNLNATKTATYSLDALSGKGYFHDPTPLMTDTANSINSGEFSESSLKLLKFRLESQIQELGSMLSATGWINVDVVKLPSAEVSKLNISYAELKEPHLFSQLYSIRFFRRREWTAGWFLCVGISGFSRQVNWWCARIKSNLGQWSINWTESIKCGQNQHASLYRLEQDYDYSSLVELSRISAAKLLCHLIEEELIDKGAKIVTLDFRHPNVDKFFNNSKLKSYLPEGLQPKNEDDNSPVMFIDNNTLSQVPNCWGDLVLLVKMSSETRTMEMILLGELKQRFYAPFSGASGDVFKQDFSENTSIEVNQKELVFSIKSKVCVENNRSLSLTADLLTVLNKLTALITLLKLVGNDQTIKLLDISLSEVTFQYGKDASESISLILANKNAEDGSRMLFDMPNSNPHQFARDYLRILLAESLKVPQFVVPRVYGSSSAMSMANMPGIISPGGLNGFITYLKLTLPLSRAIQEITSKKAEFLKLFAKKASLTDDSTPPITINGIPCLMHDVFCYGSSRFRLEYIITRKSEDQKKSGKIERVKVAVDVDLRNRGSFLDANKSLFYVSSPDTTHAPTFLKELFAGTEKFEHDGKSVVALQKGAAVAYQSIHPLLLKIHDAFYEKYGTDS
ncbi:unnamed protein product [Kuraishia capsulata CBS 1993]|uniref:Mediator of RNA polymerase II transcription subunit 14 n=1 Tax=Kuraishia capsulata CBS 1993 TaxID=1382522 RepID=W6MP90_9ASCO|nr:uncharacterized protein KUCA_T00004074001 [Kuraishia capsulata CBS 1993]CDK28093.1 unnamed protein product [Kuraishia capsulata CBS 1993]